MATGLVDLKSKLRAVENERRFPARTDIGSQKRNRFRRDPLGIAGKVHLGDVFPSTGALIPERIRMRADLDFRVADRSCCNPAAAFIDALLREGAFRVRKELLIADGDDARFGDFDAGIAPHDLVDPKQEVQLLLQRNREGIDLERSRVGSGALHGRTEIDRLTGNLSAGLRDLRRKARDAFDFNLVEIRAGCESPGISDQNADAESLAPLVADAIHVSVLHADNLFPLIDHPDVGIPGALSCRDVKRV